MVLKNDTFYMQENLVFSFQTAGGVGKLIFGREDANIYLGVVYYQGRYNLDSERWWGADEAPPLSSSSTNSNWQGPGYEAGV